VENHNDQQFQSLTNESVFYLQPTSHEYSYKPKSFKSIKMKTKKNVEAVIAINEGSRGLE